MSYSEEYNEVNKKLTEKNRDSVDPLLDMKQAVVALGYELPEVVWSDVQVKFNALSEHVISLRRELYFAVITYGDEVDVTLDHENKTAMPNSSSN